MEQKIILTVVLHGNKIVNHAFTNEFGLNVESTFAVIPSMKRFSLFLLLLLCSHFCHAQLVMPNGVTKTLGTIIDGDTVPLINLAPVEIIATLSPEAAAKMKAYIKLRRDVLKAYPYARLASAQLKFINDSITLIPSERQRAS